MEKPNLPTVQKPIAKQLPNTSKSNRVIWDCGSSLYDSFELKSFEKQLDSAILSSRTLSMPHLPDRRVPPSQPQKKPASKISRSIHKLIRSIFGSKKKSSKIEVSDAFGCDFYVYDRSHGTLSTIPEVPEFSPEFQALVGSRRTQSERFTSVNVVGISYA